MNVKLAEFGIWISYRAIGEENAGEAARVVQDLGFGALWLGGSPRLPTVRPLLDATQRLIVATGIVNVWQYEAATLAAEHAELTREFPDRLLLGIGIGHPEATSNYARPLSTMREFFDGLDRARPPVPHEERCMAALGPKMLERSALARRAHVLCSDRAHALRPRLGRPGRARRARARLRARH